MRLINRLLSVAFYICILMVVYFFFQTTTIASFRIPANSMQPALLPGDNILVNKWIMGAGIFDIWDVAEGKETEIHRLPGVGKVKRGDVLVFNFPYPHRWDSDRAHSEKVSCRNRKSDNFQILEK